MIRVSVNWLSTLVPCNLCVFLSWRPAVARKRTPKSHSSGSLIDDGPLEMPPSPLHGIISDSPQLKPNYTIHQLLEHKDCFQPVRGNPISPAETPKTSTVYITSMRPPANRGSPTVEQSSGASPHVQTVFPQMNGGKKQPFVGHHRLRAVTPQGNMTAIHKKKMSSRHRKDDFSSRLNATCTGSDLVVTAPIPRKIPKRNFQKRRKPKDWIPNAPLSDSDAEMEVEQSPLRPTIQEPPFARTHARKPKDDQGHPPFAKTPLRTAKGRTSPGKTKFDAMQGWPSLKKRMLNDGSIQRSIKPSNESREREATSRRASETRQRQNELRLGKRVFLGRLPNSTTSWAEFKNKCEMMFPHITTFVGRLQFFVVECSKKDEHCFLPFRHLHNDFCFAYYPSTEFVSNVSNEETVIGYARSEQDMYHYFQLYRNERLVGKIRMGGKENVVEILELRDDQGKESTLMDLLIEFIELFEPRVYYFYDSGDGYPPFLNINQSRTVSWGLYERFISKNLKTHWEKKYGFKLSEFKDWSRPTGSQRISQSHKQVELNIHKIRNWMLTDIKSWMEPQSFLSIEKMLSEFSSKRTVLFKQNSQPVYQSQCAIHDIVTVFDLFQRVILAYQNKVQRAENDLALLYTLLLSPSSQFKSRVKRNTKAACEYERILNQLDQARVYERRKGR